MDNLIRIAGTVNDSVVDGPGLRFTVFTQGCPHGCKGCHNPETWDMEGGNWVEMDEIVKKWRKNPMIQGITLSGGEPMAQPDKILYLIKKAKETNLDVVIYTGYLFEKLIEMDNPIINEILNIADYLIDGPFIISKLNLNLMYRGSENQRIILLKKTFEEKQIITTDNPL